MNPNVRNGSFADIGPAVAGMSAWGGFANPEGSGNHLTDAAVDMQVIGYVLAILMALQQEDVPHLSPPAIQAIGDWEGCLSANISRASQSANSVEVAAEGLLEYCRDQQRAARAAISIDLNQRMGRDGEDTTNSLETMLVLRARQNVLGQIAAARQQ